MISVRSYPRTCHGPVQFSHAHAFVRWGYCVLVSDLQPGAPKTRWGRTLLIAFVLAICAVFVSVYIVATIVLLPIWVGNR